LTVLWFIWKSLNPPFIFDYGDLLIGEKLNSIFRRIEEILEGRDRVRERVIVASREIIRLSGQAVSSIHQGRFDDALKNLNAAESIVRDVYRLVGDYDDLRSSGILNNAVCEYVEAKLLYAIVKNDDILSPEELSVDVVQYLQGIGDAIGEIRRSILENIRKGDLKRSYKLLEYMELIYGYMRALEYPEALIPGVKHRVDVARRLIDDTKAFIIDMERRMQLINVLEGLRL